MKLNIQDTFLIAHARRMRKSRQRQKQNDSELYATKVNIQQKQYRLRTRFSVLSENQTRQKINSIIKTRKTNKIRQRRYRLNE